MTTINDIAKLAGVAKSTVSRHLNGVSAAGKQLPRLRQSSSKPATYLILLPKA